MRSILFKYRHQIILVFIGLVWITFLNELLQIKNQHIIYPDSDSYREAANFFYHNFKVHYYRPLGMAIIFGLPYLFGGTDAAVFEFSFFINIMSWLGSALLVFSFLKKYLSLNKALVFALLFYSVLGLAFITFHLLTESIFTLLMLLSFYLFDKYYSTRSFHYMSLAISIMLFAILIKPGIKFMAIVLVLFFGKELLKNAFKKSSVFIYLSIAFLMFHCIKMKQEYGNFTISYIDGVTYYNYLGNTAEGLKTGGTFEEGLRKRSDYIFSFSYPEQKAVSSKDMMDQLKSNKINLLKGYFLDVANNSKSPSDCINICNNISKTGYFEITKKAMIIVSKYQNRFFTVIGLILALYYIFKSYKKPDIYTLISLYILYSIAISGISSHQGDRFHIVFFPFVIILIGKLYTEKYQKNLYQT